MTIDVSNTSIFTDETIQKAVDRLMNSPMLDFICTMPDEKWKIFQKEFFDYYYKNLWNEFGNNNVKKIKKELKKEIEIDNTDNTDKADNVVTFTINKDSLPPDFNYPNFKEMISKVGNYSDNGNVDIVINPSDENESGV